MKSLCFIIDYNFTAPWFIDALVEDKFNLMNWLKDENIGTRVMYPPLNKQKIYFSKKDYEVSNLIGEKVYGFHHLG